MARRWFVPLLLAVFCMASRGIAAAPQEVAVGQLPITLTATERAGVARPDGLSEGGIPLPLGDVRAVAELAVTDQGKGVDATIQPLAWWADGSLRWVLLRVPVHLAANETKELLLSKGEGRPMPVTVQQLPVITLRVVTDGGTITFPIEGSFEWRQGDISATVDIEPLTPRRLRLRIALAQHERAALWHAVTVEIVSPGPVAVAQEWGAVRAGHWTAAIRHAVERGPKAVAAAEGRMVLHLYAPDGRPFPADPGFHVMDEVILERDAAPDDLARRVAAPARLVAPAAYVDATRAMGRTGRNNARSGVLNEAFNRCWAEIRAQQALPRNRGWTAWGDFFDRTHGMAYAGYLNQEYDPATAFFLYALRTGDAGALDTALDMARQYADHGVGLNGACFQHRATYHALEGTIAKAVAQRVRQRWRRDPQAPLTKAQVVEYVRREYGKKAAQNFVLHARTPSGLGVAAEEEALAELFGYAMVRAARDGLRTPFGTAKGLLLGLNQQVPPFRRFAEYYLGAAPVNAFDLPPADEVFADFFARYGGSWDDFPAFHFYELPDESQSHDGAHCLVEMLVYGHLLSGDPGMRRAALQVARYLVDGGLVARATEMVAGQLAAGGSVGVRQIAWPLVDLLAVQILTEHQEPELHRQIGEAIDRLVARLVTVPPDRYEGVIHFGVAGLGLALYHERTADARAGDYLIRLARYWAERQWDDRRETFHYMKDGGDPASPALAAFSLYGLTYAAWRSGDPLLAQRAATVERRLAHWTPDYIKEFAQQFHNSQRALSFGQ